MKNIKNFEEFLNEGSNPKEFAIGSDYKAIDNIECYSFAGNNVTVNPNVNVKGQYWVDGFTLYKGEEVTVEKRDKYGVYFRTETADEKDYYQYYIEEDNLSMLTKI